MKIFHTLVITKTIKIQIYENTIIIHEKWPGSSYASFSRNC